jgi:hypothetical protein
VSAGQQARVKTGTGPISHVKSSVDQIPESFDTSIQIHKSSCRKVKVIMRTRAALLSLAVSLSFAGGQSGAATTVSPSANRTKSAEPAREITLPTPALLVKSVSLVARHLFPVRDERGLLLTCVAPEIDTNSDTDVFNNCTLAPGRTLDDVMHSFIRGIHQEQHQRMLEHADSHKGSEDHATQ